MSIFLKYAYLFFIGSVLGWCIEVVFRKFFSASNPEHHWVNPGFCTGPYLPIYGFGLCALDFISVLAERFALPVWATVLMIVTGMTLIEYAAGLICLKVFKIRLWDYSNIRGNIQGLICPLFSFFWGVLGTLYCYEIHPITAKAVQWFSDNPVFSFVIGFFFGIFILDVVHSADILVRIKKAINNGRLIIHLEKVKLQVFAFNIENKIKTHFFKFFKTDYDPAEIIKSFYKDKHSKY